MGFPLHPSEILHAQHTPLEIVKEGTALRIKALRDFNDGSQDRRAGEEWLVRREGRYLPKVHETVVGLVKPTSITEGQALILRATQSFVDFYKVNRKAGEEWLLTTEDASSHILDIYEELVSQPKRTILKEEQYCVILDPWDKESRANKKGTKLTRVGKTSFFL